MKSFVQSVETEPIRQWLSLWESCHGNAVTERAYPNSFFVLCIYTDSTSPTQIYSISTELPPAE